MNILNQNKGVFQKAARVIGSEGIIESKEQIIPSDYDSGNVVIANEAWVVQYEYKSSYEKTIEKHQRLCSEYVVFCYLCMEKGQIIPTCPSLLQKSEMPLF